MNCNKIKKKKKEEASEQKNFSFKTNPIYRTI